MASFTSFKSSLYVTPCHVAVVPITLTLATSSSIASNNTSGIKNSADAALSLEKILSLSKDRQIYPGHDIERWKSIL